MRAGAEEFDKKRKKLGKLYDDNCVYQKLSKKVTDFKDSIPLIQQLKGSSLTDRLWNKLVKETGVVVEGSIKTLTLEQVFALNLQNYSDKVNEITTEAREEHKNEEEIQKIEQAWKQVSFELVKYKKGNEDRGWVLKGTDEIVVQLEDQQANLQNVASSKYAAAFVKEIRKW